jgi:hypothetical protein
MARARKGRLKRSGRIRLTLLAGLSTGMLAGCSPAGKPPLSTENVYTNDYYVPGAGYYHAPFRAWFSNPYNYFDQVRQRYYFGGVWATSPYESITNVSSPTPLAVSTAELLRTDVSRGGFGGSYSSGGGGFFS